MMQLYLHQSYDKKNFKPNGGKKIFFFQNCCFFPLRKELETNFNQKDTVTHHLLPFNLSFIQSWNFKINESYSFFICDAIFQIELNQMQYF